MIWERRLHERVLRWRNVVFTAMSLHHSGETAPLTLPHGDPLAVELSHLIHSGNIDGLRRLVGEQPELATVRMIGRKGGWRTPLHVAADWPGYFPAAPRSVVLLLEAGADPNDDTGGERPETPLHWAASTDDVDVAVVLIDGGAALETPGGSIGTPLDNAIGYGCWNVARLLVERGARIETLWHAAALGMLDRLEDLLASIPPPTDDEINEAFWQACHGGQRRAGERLLAAGADINTSPSYASGHTALDQAVKPDTRRELLASWLRDHGAISSSRD